MPCLIVGMIYCYLDIWWILFQVGVKGVYELIIFKLMSRVDILTISSEITLRWMPQDLTDG